MSLGDAQRRVLDQMRQLLRLIGSAASDRGTLDELLRMVDDPGTWSTAHALFSRIRRKTLKTERSKSRRHEAQYLFEEVCAQTLYNLSNPFDPFDDDTPDWVVPNALHAAQEMKIDPSRVLTIIEHR